MILKRQPRNESGPFTQAQLIAIKALGRQFTVHKPWKTGETYKPNGKREIARLRQAARRLRQAA